VSAAEQGERSPRRPSGAWVLAGMVVVGMGIPAAYRWAAVELKQQSEELLAAAPSEPEARVGSWLRFGAPEIHHALEMARFSDARPWFVTHVVARRSADEPPEIHGIDFTVLPHDVAKQDGMVVRISLDAPRLLERNEISGEKALGVPVFQPGAEIPDGRKLALVRLVPYIARLEDGLQRDIPGASIEIEVGGLKEGALESQRTGSDER
jgi:hypothetical protein